MEFTKVITKRRSRYDLTNQSTLSPEQLKKRLKEALLHTPSAYNAQGSRIILALNEHHDKIWDSVLETLQTRLDENRFAKTKLKIEGFKAAYGTILFFNDTDVIQTYQDKYPKYASKTETWSHQSHGMLQYVVWTTLADANMGASLQHYNPIIDDAIQKVFKHPKSWKLTAQMPFGICHNAPKEKHFEPLDQRFKVFE